jgi:hypothetical protein
MTRTKAKSEQLLDREELSRDRSALIDGAKRLHAYRAFLARARSHKARDARNMDRLALAGARQALSDNGAFAAAAARSLRALTISGALDDTAEELAVLAKSRGPLSGEELLKRLRADDCRTCQAALGIEPELLDGLEDAIASFRPVLALVDGEAVVRGVVNGKPQQLPAPASTRRRPPPTRISELLARGRVLDLCDVLERGEPAYLLGLPPAAGAPSLDELVMTDLLAGQAEAARHVRQLEDAGLATHAGGDPGTIAIISLIALTIGVITMLVDCPDGQDVDQNLDEGGSCAFGALLAVLGSFGLLYLYADGQTPPSTSTGSQTISGPLPELAGG